MGYTITETPAAMCRFERALLNSNEAATWLEVRFERKVRAGQFRQSVNADGNGGPGTSVPIDDDAEVVRREFGWRLTSNTGRRPRP